jgi:anaerobic selenocysteine-containing dehydrogenase
MESTVDKSDIRTVHSFCRICQASCGLLVDVDGPHVLRISGDPDHPVSRGYTCSKGRSLPQMHHDANRLEFPELRGQRVSWDVMMTDLAERLRRVVDEHGPDSVACYRSTGWVLDSNGRSVVDRWVRALGTRQIYSPATIDTPNRMLVPDLICGAPFIQPVCDWDHTKLMVMFGHNVVVSHGHATVVPDALRRLRDAKENGARLIVVDPRTTETARLADEHLALRPGTDAALAASSFGTACSSTMMTSTSRRASTPPRSNGCGSPSRRSMPSAPLRSAASTANSSVASPACSTRRGGSRTSRGPESRWARHRTRRSGWAGRSAR